MEEGQFNEVRSQSIDILQLFINRLILLELLNTEVVHRFVM